MLRGFTTLNFYVDDIRAATAWYAELFGIDPYFVRPSAEDPAYVEFRVGDMQDEIGLIDSRYRPAGLATERPAGAVMNWHVDDVREAFEKLLSRGATELEAPRNLGEADWVIATVIDPFGNVLGLMHSPHYLEMLRRLKD
jgi:predicted enzyme related to lactoylglutathione lyase